MITEDYVSFEAAKLLKEKGFKHWCFKCYGTAAYHKGEPLSFDEEHDLLDAGLGDEIEYVEGGYLYDLGCNNSEKNSKVCAAPTLQMAMKWLRETHSILLIVDYDYEFTDTSYCYKIYRLGEHGKPERVQIEGVRYDMLGEPHTEIVAYRDYKRSYFDYKTYEEACEAAIKYCLEKLI